MLRRSELRKSLRGVTVSSLLIVMVMISSGCAKNSANFYSSVFDVEDYIGRKLSDVDVAKLRGFSSSTDAYVSASSKLILGHYYLTNGDRSYAKFLISKNSLAPALSEKMKLYSKLWRLDVFLSEDDTKSAGIIASEVLSTPVTKENIGVFQKYCSENNIELKLNESFKNCIQVRLDKREMKKREVAAEKKAVKDVAGSTALLTPNMEFQNVPVDTKLLPEPGTAFSDDTRFTIPGAQKEAAGASEAEVLTSFDSNGVINILDADISTDYVQGMIYAIDHLTAPYKINSIQLGYNIGEVEVGVSLKPLALMIGIKKVYFDIDFDSIIAAISKLAIVGESEKIVITCPSNRMEQASYLKSLLKDMGKTAVVYDTDNQAFQTNLRLMYEKDIDKTILNIAIGSDTEIIKFLPIIKYVQTDNMKQKILLAMNSLTITNVSNEYKGYFKDLYIITPSEQMSNKSALRLAQNYRSYFGTDITFNNMLGYDMLVFLDNLINGKNTPYLTGIVKIDNGIVYRVNKAYYIDKLQVISELK